MIHEQPQREYPCIVLDAHDGDTLLIDVDLGFHVRLDRSPLRLLGLNCPELPTPAGQTAAAYVRQWLQDHRGPWTLLAGGGSRDKFGRLLGRLRAADGHVLNDDLLAAGHAVVMKD